jgi:plastocyanin
MDNLAPVHFLLAAETSKTAFYVAGGVIVLWAVALAALGLSRDRFPGGVRGSRGVMAISLVLMLAAMATAVATASKPADEGKSQLTPIPTNPNPVPASPVPSARGGGGGAAKAAIDVRADPQQLAFDQKQLTAKAGRVTLNFDNPAQIPHNVQIEGPGAKQLGGTKTIANGKTSAILRLSAGKYTFFCSIPGHRQAGMQGTLTVR